MKVLFLSLVLLSACSNRGEMPAKHELPENIEEAVESKFRHPNNKLRDQYRHPIETLKFFGVEPHMTVVEVNPGSGWYMEILAPLLAKDGRYIMAAPDMDPTKDYSVKNEKYINDWKLEYPIVALKMERIFFSPPKKTQMPEGIADMVLTFRNVHNWMGTNGHNDAFEAFYAVLKEGGILGVVEHRAKESNKDPFAKSGYVRESDVIKMAKAAGFELVEKSEINANKKDTTNHPAGVWTLPPTLRLGEKDKKKYLAIGESDRMTLKFRKPVKE